MSAERPPMYERRRKGVIAVTQYLYNTIQRFIFRLQFFIFAVTNSITKSDFGNRSRLKYHNLKENLISLEED